MEANGSNAPTTPSLPVRSSREGLRPGKSSYSPISPFCNRGCKFVVQSSFNGHLEFSPAENSVGQPEFGVVKRLPPIERYDIELLSSGPVSGTRYMVDRTEARWNALELRIRKFARHLAERQGINALHHAAVASQDPVCVVGRVCCDGEGSLNENSVMLEGSAEYSGGQRVRLDLRNLSQFSLFPGQVIAVEAHNPSGHCLVASRIVDALPPASQDPTEDGGPAAKRQATTTMLKPPMRSPSALSIVAAAGPFTTVDNLAFKPLEELLNYARKKRPNLLVLMGPFVDSEHPQIKSGLVDKLFRHIFEEEVRSRIESYCEDMGAGARVALVPSSRDSHHPSLFPQTPFDRDFEDPDSQILLLTNPIIFRCNEVNIGCSTTDILRHLSGEEISRVPAGTTSDRMTRLSSHIIGQRSFYPLFPPALGTVLDLSLAPSSLDLPCNLDLMLLPSDLNPFVKALISHIPEKGTMDAEMEAATGPTTLSVNPGRLAKGINGGTFVEILVLPSVQPYDAGAITARSKVTILRI